MRVRQCLLLSGTIFVACFFHSISYAQAFGACCAGHGGVCGCRSGGVVCCDGFTGSSCACPEQEEILKLPTVAPTIPPVWAPTPVGGAAPKVIAARPVESSLRQYLPNRDLTPGDIRTTNREEICRPGYIQSVGRTPQMVRDDVYLAYGVRNRTKYEIDHLISKGLGGSNDAKNLWAQPYSGQWPVRLKDTLENHLHKLMCVGKVKLETAQEEIRTDWIAAFKKYLGDPEALSGKAKPRSRKGQ